MVDELEVTTGAPELVVPTVTMEETATEREANELREAMEAETRERDRDKSKPFIDHLDDAIVDGKFVVDVGEKVVIERYYHVGEIAKWLDTRSYIVQHVDHETGRLKLFDHDVRQCAMSNFIDGPKRGYRFKIPTKHTRLRGRGKSKPKKAKVEKTGPKRGRGNPGKPGMRRIYDTKKLGICTRLKGVAYIAPEGTKATAGEKLEVSAPKDGKVTVTHPDGWTEFWEERPGA